MHASRINHTPRPTAAKGFEDFRQIKHNRRYLMCGEAVLRRIKPIEAQRNGEYGWLLQVTNSITLVSNLQCYGEFGLVSTYHQRHLPSC